MSESDVSDADNTILNEWDTEECNLWCYKPGLHQTSEDNSTIPKEGALTVECSKYQGDFLFDPTQDVTKSNCYLHIDFGVEPSITLTTSKTEELSIEGSDLRYAKMFEAQLTILLSYNNKGQNIAILHLLFKTPQELVLALNGLRRCIFLACHKSEARLVHFCPLYLGIVTAGVSDVMKQGLGQENMDKKKFLCVLDQQAMMLFDTPGNLAYILYFYKEPGPDVVNKMELDKSNQQLIVTTGSRTYILFLEKEENPHTSEGGRDLHFGGLFGSMRSVRASSKDIWTDFSKYLNHYLPQVASIDVGTGAWQAHDQSGEVWDVGPLPGPSRSRHYVAQVNDAGEGYFQDSDVNAALSQSVTVEMLIGKEAKSPSEEMLEWWAAAEETINSIVSKGLVPWSVMESGGLDPNSVEHFCRCVDEIQGALFEQSYDQALSVVGGLCREFKTSRYEAVQQVVAMKHVDILRRIYFKT